MNRTTLVFILALTAVAVSNCNASITGLHWSNWDGIQTCQPLSYHLPSTEEELISIVKYATAHNETVKVVGAGHSFSPIAVSEGHLISLDRYNKIISVDTEHHTVTVEAGIRLRELNPKLEEMGLSMLNLGAILSQSVAGAISTSTHGTGRELGSMAEAVVEISIITSDGTVQRYSEGDYFNAARVGLGCIGVISEVTLQLRPLYQLKLTNTPMELNALLDNFDAISAKYERMQFFWTPYTQDATLVTREETTEPITGCWPSPQRHGDATSCVDVSYKALSHLADDSTTKYTEMEIFIPIEHTVDAVRDFIKFQESIKAFHGSTDGLFTGVRLVKADDILLSPMYKRDTAVISMIVRGTAERTGNQQEFERFARGLQDLMVKYEGRPHWGKMHYHNAEELEKLYPETWSKFLEVREDVDPHGTFLNRGLKVWLGLQ